MEEKTIIARRVESANSGTSGRVWRRIDEQG